MPQSPAAPTRKNPPRQPEAPALIADVAVGLPVAGTFHYLLPPRLASRAQIGVRVQAPFGRRQAVTGFIVGLLAQSPREGLREIDDIPDPEPIFDPVQLPFYQFIADYYFAPLGEVLRTALPAGLFKGARQVWALTEPGARALAGPLLDARDRQVLGALGGGEELTLAALENRVGGDVNRDAQRLSRWGFLEKRARLAPLTARRKMETVWRLRPGVNLDDVKDMLRRSAKRDALLDFLAARGCWSNLAQLKEAAPDPRPTLNLLVGTGYVEAADQEVYRDVDCSLPELASPEVELTDEQQAAFAAVLADIAAGRAQAHLLYGVAGSGKTEVYLRLAKECLDRGKAAIVLVPEISLTPQFLGRFIARLGPVVAPYHSGLSDGERYDQWRRMKRGEARLVVGARSALFAPFAELGLIVVDEEHEHSFKQEDGVMYHARDLALKLAALRHCPALLGSATPALETFAAARAGRIALSRLTRRPGVSVMPRVEVVDMRREMEWRRHEARKTAENVGAGPRARPMTGKKETSERRVVSRALAEALRETTAAGEQTILFLNRRGWAGYVFCLECGTPLSCPLCEISLTYHAEGGELRCHYCNYAAPPPATCPKCAGVHLFYGGMGVERLEEEVVKLLPGIRTARLDRDAVRTRHDLTRILTAFARGEADVLVGTQMVAKGHDFARVTLVGVVDADAALLLPDFRAPERAFAVLSQVAGRAGRADRPGRVLIQTFQPDHYAIEAATRHDYLGFYEQELPRREKLAYPPTTRLAALKITAASARAGAEACRAAVRAAKAATDPGDVPGAATLGPAPAMLHRVHGKHHWNLIVKADKAAGLHRLCARLWSRLEREKLPDGTFRLDVDPMSVI
jgi:primosomal protein N' (replication factor Y)